MILVVQYFRLNIFLGRLLAAEESEQVEDSSNDAEGNCHCLHIGCNVSGRH